MKPWVDELLFRVGLVVLGLLLGLAAGEARADHEGRVMRDCTVNAVTAAALAEEMRAGGVSKEAAPAFLLDGIDVEENAWIVPLAAKVVELTYAEPVRPPERIANDFYDWCFKHFNKHETF